MKVRQHRATVSWSTFLTRGSADEERVFLVGEELEFRTGRTEGEPTFVWRDMEGGVDEFFEFVATGTNQATQALFETCMYRAMYERKYKREADHLADDDLQEFIYQSVPRPFVLVTQANLRSQDLRNKGSRNPSGHHHERKLPSQMPLPL